MMNQRVYGVMGISSIMANWNADFSGYPKTTSKGEIFGSDKAFKYPMKKMWDENGEKVLYIRSMRIKKDDKTGDVSLVPRTLLERYKQLFETEDIKDVNEVLTNLFLAIDVKNFGATFVPKSEKKSKKEDDEKRNISITGAVQFGQGINKYMKSESLEQQILSPFRNPNEDKVSSTQTSLGTKIVSDEAHYFYPFSVNPKAYKEYVDLGVTEGYTEDDYLKFKHAALCAATSFATNAKAGCENEFGLFIETQENVYLPNIAESIQFQHQDKDKNIICVRCGELLREFGAKIQNVELYYNPYTTVIETDIPNVKMYHIFTRKEL